MATMTHTSHPATAHIPQTVRNVAAVAVGAFLALHGAAHSLAFFVQWQITHPKGIAYTTTLFYGKIDVGDVGIRIDGLLWLVAAAAFVVVGLRLARLRRVDVGGLLSATLFSLALCILGLSQAIVGVWIDVAVLAALVLVVTLRQRQTA
jgi:hypothetical protein